MPAKTNERGAESRFPPLQQRGMPHTETTCRLSRLQQPAHFNYLLFAVLTGVRPDRGARLDGGGSHPPWARSMVPVTRRPSWRANPTKDRETVQQSRRAGRVRANLGASETSSTRPGHPTEKMSEAAGRRVWASLGAS